MYNRRSQRPSANPLKSIQILDSSGIPIYIQLKTQLEYWIATGQIPENVQLPPVRTLASQLGIAVDTVRQAYDTLERQGLATTKRGLGTYTCLPKERQADAEGAETERLVHRVDAFLGEVLREGYAIPSVLKTARHRLALLERGPVIAFVGVRPSIERYAKQLGHTLNKLAPVLPIAIEDLRAEPEQTSFQLRRTTHVVVLTFHAHEVDAALAELPVRVLPLVSQLEDKVVHAIGKLPRGSRPLLICREASRPIYEGVIQAQRPPGETLLFAPDDSADAIAECSRKATIVLHTTVARAAVERAGVNSLPCIELLHTATAESLDRVNRAIQADWLLTLQMRNSIGNPDRRTKKVRKSSR